MGAPEIPAGRTAVRRLAISTADSAKLWRRRGWAAREPSGREVKLLDGFSRERGVQGKEGDGTSRHHTGKSVTAHLSHTCSNTVTHSQSKGALTSQPLSHTHPQTITARWGSEKSLTLVWEPSSGFFPTEISLADLSSVTLLQISDRDLGSLRVQSREDEAQEMEMFEGQDDLVK